MLNLGSANLKFYYCIATTKLVTQIKMKITDNDEDI